MSSSSNPTRPTHVNRVMSGEEVVGASLLRFGALGEAAAQAGQPARPKPTAPMRAKPEAKPAEALAAVLEQRYQAGLVAGHANGFAQGMQEANARIDALRAEFSALAVSMHNSVATLEDEVAGRIIGLVHALARQVVRSELAVRPEAVADVVDECLALVSESVSRIVIHLNPADLALIGERLVGEDSRIQLHPDAGMTRGGCRVVTSHGEIDGTLEHRIARALDVLKPSGTHAGT
ncbi:hypothetical protein BH10PSE17_BH10PSE17_07190 [soil metagenome]